MSIVRWSPFRELAALQKDMDRLFSQFDGGEVAGKQSWLLPMDVIETKDAIKLRAAVPGMNREDIHVEVDDNVLTVKAERRFEEKHEEGNYYWLEQQYGTFSRSVTLPKYADVSHISAEYREGVLELTVPRREEAKPRRIELTTTRDATPAIESAPAEAK